MTATEDAIAKLEEFSQYGVLGMKWGVRKDRRRRKDGPTPAKNVEDHKPTTPPQAEKRPKIRNSISDEDSSLVPSRDGRPLTIQKLNQKQRSKLGSEGLKTEDLSTEQLQALATRLRIESEVVNLLKSDRALAEKKAVVERIKIEQEYARLTAKPPSEREIKKAKRQAKIEQAKNKLIDKTVDAGINIAVQAVYKQLGFKVPPAPKPDQKDQKQKSLP